MTATKKKRGHHHHSDDDGDSGRDDTPRRTGHGVNVQALVTALDTARSELAACQAELDSKTRSMHATIQQLTRDLQSVRDEHELLKSTSREGQSVLERDLRAARTTQEFMERLLAEMESEMSVSPPLPVVPPAPTEPSSGHEEDEEMESLRTQLSEALEAVKTLQNRNESLLLDNSRLRVIGENTELLHEENLALAARLERIEQRNEARQVVLRELVQSPSSVGQVAMLTGENVNSHKIAYLQALLAERGEDMKRIQDHIASLTSKYSQCCNERDQYHARCVQLESTRDLYLMQIQSLRDQLAVFEVEEKVMQPDFDRSKTLRIQELERLVEGLNARIDKIASSSQAPTISKESKLGPIVEAVDTSRLIDELSRLKAENEALKRGIHSELREKLTRCLEM